MTANHVLVLSRQFDAYAVRRFVEAAAKLKLEFSLLDPHQISLALTASQPGASLDPQQHLPAQCIIVPRLGSTATEYSLAVLDMLERTGARSLNPYASLMLLRNKFSALAHLAAQGLPVPDSTMLRVPGDIEAAVQQVGGYPVVLKFIRGSQGVGVVYAPDESVVVSVLEALNVLQYDVLIQRYYERAARQDLRVFVLGGEPRWAVRRTSSNGRFRSNFHRGGVAAPAQLDAPTAALAQRAAAVFGLGMAGVDLIEGPQGWLVMEVNSSPGFETIEHAHQVDAAAEILNYAAQCQAS